MLICYLGEASSVHVQRWASWFARRNHEVHLVSLSSREVPGVRVHPFPRGGALSFPRKALAIRRIVREIGPDLLHSHQAVGYGLWGALAGFHPFIVSAWGSDVLVRPKESWAQGRVLRYVIRKADFCIPVAAHLRERMRPFGLREERSEAIPMGVELDTYPPQPYLRGSRPPRFISVRALEPIYDLPTFVRASREILAADPDIRGSILGGGSLRAELEGFARRLGIADRLGFEGSLPPDRVMASLAAARVYVSTSKSDGASVSLLEAMARGCFPVVTDIPANREWIVSGQNGFLFPVGDSRALAASVLEAMGNESLLEGASRQNIATVRQRGDLNTNLERVEQICERLVEMRR